jgi:endonuclease-3
MSEAKETMRYVIQNLRATYGRPKRTPGLDPLDVLIETILSQSTTRINSQRAFDSLKQRFADWGQARRARRATIEAAIHCGGLAEQKSQRIKQLLTDIYERQGSLDLSFLCTAPLAEAREFLSRLKGVGPKTIACTLLFACNRPVFPIDVHIFRIARRLGLIPERSSDQAAHSLMEAMIPPAQYYETHMNLIKHGRTICRPQNPACERCCLIDYCQYYTAQAV